MAQPRADCGGQPDPGTDPMDEVRASLVATCGAVAPASAASLLTVEAAFVGEGSRFCDPPSRSVVAPRWEGSLQLDAPGVYRVAVTAFSDVPLERLATAERRCLVSVDGSPGDPILLGESRIATRHVRGPATVPVALECSALVHLACNARTDEVPVTTRSALHLRVDVVQAE